MIAIVGLSAAGQCDVTCDVSRDVQVRVVFCDWLAWLLLMKKCRHDVSPKSLLDKHQPDRHSNDRVTQAHEPDYAEDGCSTRAELLTSVSVQYLIRIG